jgi:2-polyprenyl-6-methoxyphenol hydroxylase-like FAD-dependent oxidoreductase
MRVPRTIGPRVALIGDAAHAIHPLSGHGINLGYQDAAVLARVLGEAPQGADLGDERLLRRYERSRREEVAALQWTTHGLQRLFRPQAAPLALLRNAGLNLTNSLPIVRSMLARYATLGPAL